MPHRRSKGKERKFKDSGSSGGDRDRSSGSRKSDRRKSGERIARKPSKELLKIQNFSNSSDDECFALAKRGTIDRKSETKFSDSRSFYDQFDLHDWREDSRLTTDGTSSKTDLASSLSPSSFKRSPNINRSKMSPKHNSKRHSKSFDNPTKRAPTPPSSKSLNMQIKEFVKASSPPKSRKYSEASHSSFDAFNHISSTKVVSKEVENNSSFQHTVQQSEPYDDYEYFHPRRSSKEVLDFTSSRKSNRDNRHNVDDKDKIRRKSIKEEKGHKSDGSEGHSNRQQNQFQKEDLRNCRCLSPPVDNEAILTEVSRSPSSVREDKEIFDFTSRKLNCSTEKKQKAPSKESKFDIRNAVDNNCFLLICAVAHNNTQRTFRRTILVL